MIPLESATVILPRMPTTGKAATGEFNLTIMKPPVLDVNSKSRTSPSLTSSPVYRLLRSRNQRRNSSAPCKVIVPERVEVFELTSTGHRGDVESALLQESANKDAYILPDHIRNCQGRLLPSKPAGVVPLSQEFKTPSCSVEETPEVIPENCDCIEDGKQQFKSTDTKSTEEIKSVNDCIVKKPDMENETSPSISANKKSAKTCKVKKARKKRKKSIKKGQGVSSMLARLVGYNVGQKKLQGQTNSDGETQLRAGMVQCAGVKMSPNIVKCLNIQKLHAAYAPKKYDNKNISCRLPQVSNNSLIKHNAGSGTSLPGKQQEEIVHMSLSLMAPLPQKLQDSDNEKVKKIFLSETHSAMIAGIPCAPPSTPIVDEKTKVEYIPSLTDVKSQRAVKARLINIGNNLRAQEQRRKEKSLKDEQKRAYGAILQLKQRQRAEIYALNKVMTELENANFRKFMEENAAETLPV